MLYCLCVHNEQVILTTSESSPTCHPVGLGAYLMANPGMDAIDRLSQLLGGATATGSRATCPAALRRYQQQVMSPLVNATMATFLWYYGDITSSDPVTLPNNVTAVRNAAVVTARTAVNSSAGAVALSTQQDAFAWNFTKSRVLASAAMVDPVAADFACSLYSDLVGRMLLGGVTLWLFGYGLLISVVYLQSPTSKAVACLKFPHLKHWHQWASRCSVLQTVIAVCISSMAASISLCTDCCLLCMVLQVVGYRSSQFTPYAYDNDWRPALFIVSDEEPQGCNLSVFKNITTRNFSLTSE